MNDSLKLRPSSCAGAAREDADWPRRRARVLRNAAGVGLAVGALGLSFGALAAASGFSVPQSCVLSLLMFSGASQFALVGVLGGGGSALAGAATAILLGTRNCLYGLKLSSMLRVRGLRRLGAAQLVLDESTAMAIGQRTERESRLAFWATGAAVFIDWNLATFAGAMGAKALPDPNALGLDMASPAAFVALLAPRMRTRRSWAVAGAAAAVALATTPLLPAGTPVLLAALVAVAAAAPRRPRRRRDHPDEPEGAQS